MMRWGDAQSMNRAVGVLMLATRFERIVGDIGNEKSFPFPMRYYTVPQATVSRVVKEADRSLLAPFIEGAQALEASGVGLLTTSCGFLALFQAEIARAISIPFLSSSLMQVPLLNTLYGGRIGILSASAHHLTEAHFGAMGIDRKQIVVMGMEEKPNFRGAIIEERILLNPSRIETEMAEITAALMAKAPDLRAIVLECTNMSPYIETVRRVAQRPVYDLNQWIEYHYGALMERGVK